LILDGKLYHGTTDCAGEVGHVRLADTGPTAYGKAGSWEGYCSGTGIVRLAAYRHPERWPEGTASVQDLAQCANSGDADALRVFEEAGERLGQGLSILVDVLNPEVIVIGSLAFRLGELVMGPALKRLRKEALPQAFEACRVVPAALGERLGDVASFCAAINHIRMRAG